MKWVNGATFWFIFVQILIVDFFCCWRFQSCAMQENSIKNIDFYHWLFQVTKIFNFAICCWVKRWIRQKKNVSSSVKWKSFIVNCVNVIRRPADVDFFHWTSKLCQFRKLNLIFSTSPCFDFLFSLAFSLFSPPSIRTNSIFVAHSKRSKTSKTNSSDQKIATFFRSLNKSQTFSQWMTFLYFFPLFHIRHTLFHFTNRIKLIHFGSSLLLLLVHSIAKMFNVVIRLFSFECALLSSLFFSHIYSSSSFDLVSKHIWASKWMRKELCKLSFFPDKI